MQNEKLVSDAEDARLSPGLDPWPAEPIRRFPRRRFMLDVPPNGKEPK
jgi:hypothetical protein